MRASVPLLVMLLGLPACAPREGADTPPDVGSIPAEISFLSPRPGAVVVHGRIDIALVLPPERAGQRLRVRLDGAEITHQVEPAYRRMRSLGGGAVAVGRIDLPPDAATGERVLSASLEGSPPSGADGSVAEARFEYRPGSGRLSVEIAADGTPGPARLHVDGIEGTPSPDFATPGWMQVDPRGQELARRFIDSADGREDLGLPPGRYRLTASRGIEFEIDSREVTVPEDGTPVDVRLDLARAFDTPGWLSADLHVHASPSFDAFVSLDERLRGYLAAGVEVLVATDHHVLTDFAPSIAAIPGARKRIVSLIGVETALPPRGGVVGHWNLFPFAQANGETRGWPRPAVAQPADIYRLFAEGDTDHVAGMPDGIVELNHPRGIRVRPSGDVRGEDSAGWFSAAGFDPAAPLAGAGGMAPAGPNAFLFEKDAGGRHRNLDLDAIEILNRFSLELYGEVRRDWFALLNAGHLFTGTANSDSHHRTLVGPGFPRNYVRLTGAAAEVSGFDAGAFVTAIREHRVMGTTGPFIEVTAGGGAGPGSTVTASGGRVTLRVRVRAATWVPVPELRVFLDGRLLQRVPLPPGGVLRFDEAIEVPVSRDGWIVLEAGARLDAVPPPATSPYAVVAPGFTPLAFTNPIFIDAEGDGWRPVSPPSRP